MSADAWILVQHVVMVVGGLAASASVVSLIRSLRSRVQRVEVLLNGRIDQLVAAVERLGGQVEDNPGR